MDNENLVSAGTKKQMVSNRCLDIINDIVNLFIMRFDTAG